MQIVARIVTIVVPFGLFDSAANAGHKAVPSVFLAPTAWLLEWSHNGDTFHQFYYIAVKTWYKV